MKTVTQTNNFKPVTVSTKSVEGKIETIIFFNGCEIWATNKVQNIIKQHKIGVAVAAKYNLCYGIENGCAEPLFSLRN